MLASDWLILITWHNAVLWLAVTRMKEPVSRLSPNPVFYHLSCLKIYIIWTLLWKFLTFYVTNLQSSHHSFPFLGIFTCQNKTRFTGLLSQYRTLNVSQWHNECESFDICTNYLLLPAEQPCHLLIISIVPQLMTICQGWQTLSYHYHWDISYHYHPETQRALS